MRCGVLCDKDGNIKRRWALVNCEAIIETEAAGDEHLEWNVDHGASEPNPARAAEKIAKATAEQQTIMQMTALDDALRHNWEQARIVTRKEHRA